MTTAVRVKAGLIAIASVITTLFAWNTVQGQIRPPVMRPPNIPGPIGPRPGMPGGIRGVPGGINGVPGGFNGVPGGVNGMPGGIRGVPGGGMTTTVWRCPSCGFEYRGTVPPATCPGCRKQMSNGVGNGVPGPGGNVSPNPGMNPGFPPPVIPPVMNPNQPGGPPVIANPPGSNSRPGNIAPVSNPSDKTSSSASDSSTGESKPTSKKWVIALVIGIIVVGVFVLLGGTFLVIYTVRSGSSAPKGRRRRRVDDDD